MRQSLGILDTSPLRPTSARNHFEHFDERLDEWWATSKQHNRVDQFIGPHGAVTGVDDRDIFRYFDPTTATLIFWGEHYPLNPIMAEVERILPVVRREAAKPHWDPDSTSGGP